MNVGTRVVSSFLLVFCWVFLVAFDKKNTETETLYREVKCPTCQGQSIADSNTDAAREIRTYIDEEFRKGTSILSIKEDLVKKYGETILFEPPMTRTTALLWGAPFLLLLGFLGLLALKGSRRRS